MAHSQFTREPVTEEFPWVGTVPSAAWCRDHEHCHTLDDYLRRRTNIAQWTPRCGLGADSEYRERAVCLGDITRIIELQSPSIRFAATSMGIKTRIAPMSAALGRVSLRKLPEFNRIRNENHRWLSDHLEKLGFDTFLPGERIERVYFEFLIRHRDPDFETPRSIEILQALGCQVAMPRYPLLHEQPFFREGHVTAFGRYPDRDGLHDYADIKLPQTERENLRLIKLPNFCHPDTGLLEQYLEAFAHALKAL